MDGNRGWTRWNLFNRQLLDEGVDPKDIMWVDPYFQVGDF